MNGKNTRRGFTLIELLVVVIIIAILAAIALPQYNKAVKKARVAELQTFIAHVEKAMDLYVLENGYANAEYIAWEKLGIDVSSYCDSVGGANTGYKCTAKNFAVQAPIVYADGLWNFVIFPSESVFGGEISIDVRTDKAGTKGKTCNLYSLKAKPLCDALKASDPSWVIDLSSAS